MTNSQTTDRQPPRSQRSDARRNREKVLSAARARFAEDGLDAQIDEIAADAGVGVGTVYRHFPTKLDLLEALAEERFEGLADAARLALEVADPWEAFAGFMTYSARVMAEDRALSEAMDQHSNVCQAASERVGLLALVGEVVERAQAAGQLRGDLVAWDVPSIVCGIGRAVRAREGMPVMSWERYLEIILAGVRVHGDEPSA
ncbi:MAG: TetR/AcrR family transcriptional regulator [Vicinamibacteria bacterium]|jgi:AcrR family transcriptional regulator